jgi:drug/metabolite transporter (DMT)-like permease
MSQDFDIFAGTVLVSFLIIGAALAYFFRKFVKNKLILDYRVENWGQVRKIRAQESKTLPGRIMQAIGFFGLVVYFYLTHLKFDPLLSAIPIVVMALIARFVLKERVLRHREEIKARLNINC